jgi:hypothetical protein
MIGRKYASSILLARSSCEQAWLTTSREKRGSMRMSLQVS